MQYADDCKALLPGGSNSQISSRAASFVAAMRTFRAASGQQLAEEKTKMLPIGAVPEQLPDSLAVLKVVHAASALGLTFRSGTQPPEADWQARLQQVEACFTRLAKLHLSAFGRGMGSAAYGVSKLLYLAEYAGMPDKPTLKRLSTITANLVDGGKAPAFQGQRFNGIAADLLAGNPRSGGFGALPWEQHVRARHAAWGVRLALASLDRPWAAVADAVLQQLHPQLSAAALLSWRPGHSQELQLPPPLLRMWQGFKALGHIRCIGSPPDPGPWCCSIPIWSNPLLQLEPAAASPLEWAFPELRDTGLRRIPQLLFLHHQAQHASPEQLQQWWHQHFDYEGAPASLQCPLEVREQLAALLQHIPPAWQEAAWEHCGSNQQPSEAEATAVMLGCLGWQRQQGQPLALEKFRVKHGTLLQL
jgi:hypothetical protein